MDSIELNESGYVLLPNAVFEEGIVFKGEEKSKTIGTHGYCCGMMDLIPVAPSFSAIVCRGCFFHMAIPANIKTAKALREYCARKIAKDDSSELRRYINIGVEDALIDLA